MVKPVIAAYFLLGINVFAFAVIAFQQQSLMMDGNKDVLAIIHAGANLNPLTLGGQPWRIITSMFLHFGVVHLLANMLALYVLGNRLEPALGNLRFVLVYFCCGVGAGLASLLFNLYTPSAGASGAVFGLFGYWLGAEIIESFNDRQRLLSVFLTLVTFVFINASIATVVRVDMAGHVGGFVSGLLLATFHFKLRWAHQKRYLAAILLVLTSTLFILPRDLVFYYNLFQRVLVIDRHTNRLFNTKSTNDQLKDSLSAILPQWDSTLSILNALPRVPAQLSSDTSILRDYIQLRRKDAYYRIQQFERGSYIYYDSVEIIGEKLGALPKLQYVLNYTESAEGVEENPMMGDNLTLEPTQIFYDVHWKEITDSANAKFYRLGKKDSAGRWQGQVLDYYKNRKVQMKGKYLNDMKDGVFIYYSDHNTYESAGRYEKEQAIGKWENFHWNGALESEVFYGDHTFTANVWDSLGNPQVVNGNGKSVTWFASGKVAEEGNYKDGRRDGYWFGFHSNGKPYYKEQYHDNMLVHGVSEDKDGKRFVYDHLSQFPFPVNGMPALQKYIVQNIRRPPSPFAGGKVKVLFTVGMDGEKWNYVVIQSLSAVCDQEAIRLIKEGPAWRPALLHGQEKVSSQGYVEVIFD